MTTSTCTARNTWTDSGDRGAARCDHDRAYHPDHTHVWGDSTYEWEQVGQMWIAPGDGIKTSRRTVTVQRCEVCNLRDTDNAEGTCSSAVSM